MPTRHFDFVAQAVYGHLLFGPMARGNLGDLFSWASVLIFCFAIVTLTMTQDPPLIRLTYAVSPATILLCLHLFKIQSKPLLFQARIGWWITKTVCGLWAIFGCLLPGIVRFLQHSPTAWFWISLGALWVPGVEFVPYFAPRQRLVTILRVVITALLIFNTSIRHRF